MISRIFPSVDFQLKTFLFATKWYVAFWVRLCGGFLESLVWALWAGTLIDETAGNDPACEVFDEVTFACSPGK